MSRKITVHNHETSLYDIIIEKDYSGLCNAFDELGIHGRKLCIVTDSNVGPLYGNVVNDELSKTGNQCFLYTFRAGEQNKNLNTVEDLYEYLIQNKFDRKDVLVALGGGVVGDLTGFTAATYLRGIKFIQLPTSLLAQVDSSIGGKTGVDFRAYKNMVGAFHQPSLVYMSLATLGTLNERLFNSGLGEIIKHGLIKDKNYYRWLIQNTERILQRDIDTLEEMIYISCNIKRNVVELDPTEQGDRALLNFGHTLGHAIEKQMNFRLYHGECVVLGMITALYISMKRGMVTKEDYQLACETFKKYNFPMKVEDVTTKDIIAVSKNDKKMDAGKIKFILLRCIGQAYIDKTVTDEEMMEALQEVIS
jgi:3-dehydroquinate synthase